LKEASSAESADHRWLKKCARLVKWRDFQHIIAAVPACASQADLGPVVEPPVDLVDPGQVALPVGPPDLSDADGSDVA
jgi:hypothetical protein